MSKQNNTLGILLSFAGYTAWVGDNTLVKLAGKTLPITEILPISFVIGTLFIIVTAMLNGGAQKLRTKQPTIHLARSILIMGATCGAVAGVIHLSLADFYTIIFTSPLILTVLASFFLKEKVDFKMWLAIVFGFLGVIIAVQFSGSKSSQFSWIGITVTTLASVCLALTMLTARSVKNETNYSLSFWPQFISCIVSISVMIFLGNIVLDKTGIIFALLSGIMGSIGLLLTNASLRVAPVAVVSPYHYTQIIGGAIMGYLIWRHVPAWSVVIGAIMVTLSGLYIIHAENRKKTKTPYMNTANFPA